VCVAQSPRTSYHDPALWNAPERTGMHRNTLQHCASRCNTLQHDSNRIALQHCNATAMRRLVEDLSQMCDNDSLQRTATYCNATATRRRVEDLSHMCDHDSCLFFLFFFLSTFAPQLKSPMTSSRRSTPLCAATHCHALQCTAMHCNALQCSAKFCNALQCSAKFCNNMRDLLALFALSNELARDILRFKSLK